MCTRTRSLLCVLALCLLASAGCSDIDLEEAKASRECLNEADYTGRTRPFHTISIDTANDFNAETERFLTSAAESSAAYVTWDQCRIYFGYRDTTFDAGASPYEYLVYYIDTDPLGDDGSDEGRPFFQPPQLPFEADYLVTIRADAATAQAGSTRAYERNAQFYKYAQKWNPGFMQSWEPWKREALTVGGSRTSNLIEAALDRSALGHPCAIQVVGWIVNTRSGERRSFWPAPPNEAARAPASDSSALNYYGFPLVNRVRPSDRANLNRIDYSAVGACARGDQMTQ